MPTNQLERILHTLQKATLHQESAGQTDGQLLETYVRSREETAVAALVHRHGPMVWGVCRRVLRSHHDAEDAFQATFLVLVRKAASVTPRDMVANWLYGVAHQTALKARATAARRGEREKQVTAMPEPALQQRASSSDLHTQLDQELSRLPDKYRSVIVLCDLEGKTRKEAARHFRLPEGTIASRLATARTMLARRLARSGATLSGTALALALAQDVASASVPLPVASTTIKAATLLAAEQAAAGGALSASAVALAEGVLKTMLLTKLKTATAVLVLATVLGGGAVALTQQVLADKRNNDPPTTQKKEAFNQPATRQTQPAAQAAPDKKDVDLSRLVVSGIVKAVDAEKKTIIVADQKGQRSFTVAKDAHISIDLKPGQLTALPPGALVNLSQFVDPATTCSIQAHGSSVFARVKAVDLATSTITVTGPPEDRTFKVATETVIRIDGKPAGLTAIPQGASLHALNLCVDQQTAQSINVEGPSFHHVPVKAIDPEKNTITIDDKAPTEVAGKTLPLTPDAGLLIDGKQGKLTGIPPGAFVNVVLTVDMQSVRNLHAEGPVLGGCGGSMVNAVDVEKNSFTFDDKAPPDVAGKTITLAKDANILIDGRPGKLADLPTGSFVTVCLSVDQSVGRSINAQGPGLGDCDGSMVKAVDAAQNIITFDDKACAEVAGKTFRIAPDANIVIDGKLDKLAGLPTGSYVNVVLSADRSMVRNLRGHGATVSGVVTVVDAAKHILTLGDRTFSVAPAALIVIGGQRGELPGLRTGVSVNVQLHVDQQTVGMIQAKTP
jgi:RNA polymerase sigma factor (sigma-70 family)